ncbi:hypothetical protein J6590_082733 [Homalodisca vitripennis]|nr:hypothetical protein J6590_082733 [Homalodisca vitripennis]
MCGRNSLLTLLSYENVPNSVEISCFSVKSVICWVLTLPVREKRGTEGIPIWRRGREKLAGTGEPNLTFLVSRVFNMAAPMMNWREQGNITSFLMAAPSWRELGNITSIVKRAGTGELTSLSWFPAPASPLPLNPAKCPAPFALRIYQQSLFDCVGIHSVVHAPTEWGIDAPRAVS